MAATVHLWQSYDACLPQAPYVDANFVMLLWNAANPPSGKDDGRAAAAQLFYQKAAQVNAMMWTSPNYSRS